MSRAVIVGGGVAGLTAALALRPLGYEVEILDREPGPVPSPDAVMDWIRPSVPHAQHSHTFTTLGIGLLRERLPELYAALLDAGAYEINMTTALPPALRGALPDHRAGDLVALACRRRTFDVVYAASAERLGVLVRRGAVASELLLRDARVAGVRLRDGTVVRADIVIDAAGRQGMSPRWLGDAGVEVADDESHPTETVVYTRFFRCRGDGLPAPLNRGNAAGAIFSHFMAFVHPGDRGTYSMSIGVLASDPLMRALRHAPAFTALAAATPMLAPWVAETSGEPLSPVHIMACGPNVVRGVATTRQPPVPGLFQLGDAACVTNPLYGRGVALAIAHAFGLADVLASHPRVDEQQHRLVAELTERLNVPWVRRAAYDDLERLALWHRVIHGEDRFLPENYFGLGTAAAAATFDATVWHRLTRVQMSLDDPRGCYGDPEFQERVRTALAGREPSPVPAPGRDEAARVLAAATEAAR